MFKTLFKFFTPPQPLATFATNKELKIVRESYSQTVSKIKNKYYKIDNRGSLIVRLIVDYRASAIAGGELSVSCSDELVESQLLEFIEQNRIQKKIIEYAQLAEREGRLAIVLYSDNTGKIKIKALPWSEYKYNVIFDDFGEFVGIEYNSENGNIVIKKPYVCYMQYAGIEEYSPDTIPPPKVGYCIDDIEAIEDELQKWYAINEYFAHPTPHFNTDEITFFDKLKRLIVSKQPIDVDADLSTESPKNRRWKMGEGIITYKSQLNYVQADMRGVESLDRFIQVRMQRISAFSGVPIFIMYPELMTNRATSRELAAEINSFVQIERRKHEEMWTDVMRSYNTIRNASLYDSVNDSIYAVLPLTAPAHIQLLIDTFLPLVNSQIISKETLQEMLPGIDPQTEKERLNNDINDLINSIPKEFSNITENT